MYNFDPDDDTEQDTTSGFEAFQKVRADLAAEDATAKVAEREAGAKAERQIAGEPEPETDTERTMRMFPRIVWADLWEKTEDAEWLHYPLLPARRLVTLFSAAKVGKSLLMLEFAVAISRGEMFMGEPCVQKRVLYVDFENDPEGDVRSRLQAMGRVPDELDNLVYLSFPTLAALDSERGSLELMEVVKAYQVEVVIIDTVSRTVNGEENKNDTWLTFYRHTGLKLKQARVALIRLDHSGKDETKGQRGGSAKSGDVDVIWQLTRVTESRFRLDCKDTRLPIGTKTLTVDRLLLPRLHHTLVAAGGVSDFQAKVNALVALCDANDLASDANRETVRDFAITRGIKASYRVVEGVVKYRKNCTVGTVQHLFGEDQKPDFAPSVQQSAAAGEESELSTKPTPKLHGDTSVQQRAAVQAELHGGAAVRSTAPACRTPKPDVLLIEAPCPICELPSDRPGGGLCQSCYDRQKAAS
jgi:hypothetical protein